MYKCYINGTRPLFSTNYSALRSNVYCTPKTEEILNLTVCVRFRFLHLRNIRGDFLDIPKKILPKLILHLHRSYQLDDVRLQEYYIHSTYLINLCILNKCNALLSRTNDNFF